MLNDLMATETEEPGGLDWSFGSYVFQEAFVRLSTSLWWMFWGLVMQLFGAALAIAPIATTILKLGNANPALVVPGVLLMVVGGIVLLVGEQKCLHLEVPLGMTRSLPGHGLLRGAYWCHLGSWLLRLAKHWIGRGPMSLMVLPLVLAGYILLLLFLRKTADVLARGDLKRLVDLIFLFGGSAFMIGLLWVAEVGLQLGLLKVLPRSAALALLGLPIGLFVLTTGLYAILLSRMASAASAFATYLATIEAPESSDSDEDEDNGDVAQD
jgi:hypothetical protein